MWLTPGHLAVQEPAVCHRLKAKKLERTFTDNKQSATTNISIQKTNLYISAERRPKEIFMLFITYDRPILHCKSINFDKFNINYGILKMSKDISFYKNF